MENARLFIALELPVIIRRELRNSFLSLPLPSETLRVVSEDNLHITLKFIGEVPLDRLVDIVAALDELRSALHPTTLSLGHGMLVPSHAPRTLGISVRGDDELAALAGGLDSTLFERGIARAEHRRFVPHITLARLNRPLALDLRHTVEEWTVRHKPWTAENFALFESELTRTGPRYTRLKVFELA